MTWTQSPKVVDTVYTRPTRNLACKHSTVGQGISPAFVDALRQSQVHVPLIGLCNHSIYFGIQTKVSIEVSVTEKHSLIPSKGYSIRAATDEKLERHRSSVTQVNVVLTGQVSST